jgi:hypothetical protein
MRMVDAQKHKDSVASAASKLTGKRQREYAAKNFIEFTYEMPPLFALAPVKYCFVMRCSAALTNDGSKVLPA